MNTRQNDSCKNYGSYSDKAAEVLLNRYYIYQLHIVVAYPNSLKFGTGILKFIIELVKPHYYVVL